MGSEAMQRERGEAGVLRLARLPGPWPARLRAVWEIDRALLDFLRRDRHRAAVLCAELGLLSRSGGEWNLTEAVSESGYGAESWAQLADELRARLTAWPTRREAASALRSPSRLVTARHLIAPEDVVAEIRRRLVASRGNRRLVRDPRGLADDEAERALRDLPEYERRIAWGLLRDQAVFWSPAGGMLDAEHPEFDDLVEQPPGTVVVVVRPPASDLELELKRTGMAGRLGDAVKPLSVVQTRVPSHRLAGGSTVPALSFEAKASACLSVAFEQIHGTPAPVSRALGLRVVLTVPSHGGTVFLTDYFTRPELFGPGYGAMRSALHGLVDEDVVAQGAFAATTAFLQRMPPAQVLLAGTSAWRLDRLAELLSRHTPQGFGVASGDGDEVGPTADPAVDPGLKGLVALALGRYTAPTEASDPDQMGAILTVDENRARADAVYQRLMEQLGNVWGTVWGLGGHAQGESFVGRNVGLRRVQRGGRPEVELVFMDHDNLFFPGPELECPQSQASLSGWFKDELAILGGALRGRYLEGTAELLERIYRIGFVQRERGRRVLHRALVDAYHRSRAALRRNDAVRELFHPELAEHLDRRDEVLRLVSEGSPDGNRGAGSPGVGSPGDLDRFTGLLRRYASLFESR